MDDWDEIVRDAGEEHPEDVQERQDSLKESTSAFVTTEPPEKTDDTVDQVTTLADDEEQCRICFSGADDDDEEEKLGRLISPCQCRGTMSKVHINCLNRWRNASAGRKSFYQCDQCGYRYRIQRAKIAGLAENKIALASLAMSFFIVLVMLNGLIGNWLLNKARNQDSILGAVFFEGPHIDDYAYSSFSYRDSYLPLEAVGQAVDLAQKVVSEGLQGFSHNKEGRKRTHHKGERHTKMVRIEYKNADGRTAYRMVKQAKTSKLPGIPKKAMNWLKQAARFVAVGISMTGIGSFFWLILTLPLWPLHPFRNGLFRSLRGTRDARGGLSPMGTVLVVLFVIVGLIKSVHMCWSLANRTAKAILKRAELGILEVNA